MHAGAVILFPAIDIAGGRAVRLVQGDFDAETVYEDDPFDAARAWVDAGARYLHVVDLDGARTGAPVRTCITSSASPASSAVPVQCGGGLRSIEAVRDAVSAGAARVILGTAAFTDVDFLDEVVAELGERTVVSVDTRGGFVSTAGWTETTTLPAAGVIEPDAGPRRADVRLHERRQGRAARGPGPRRGARGSPRSCAGASCTRAGIGKREDLVALAGLRQVNLTGVIVGKALYERRFTVAEGQAALAPQRGRRATA